MKLYDAVTNRTVSERTAARRLDDYSGTLAELYARQLVALERGANAPSLRSERYWAGEIRRVGTAIDAYQTAVELFQEQLAESEEEEEEEGGAEREETGEGYDIPDVLAEYWDEDFDEWDDFPDAYEWELSEIYKEV